MERPREAVVDPAPGPTARAARLRERADRLLTHAPDAGPPVACEVVLEIQAAAVGVLGALADDLEAASSLGEQPP